MLDLPTLNTASAAAFCRALDGLYDPSPWVLEAACAKRPFATVAALKRTLAEVVRDATPQMQIALIRTHRDPASAALVAGCSPAELDRIQQLSAEYVARFGHPFVLAVRGPRGIGLSSQQVIATFERRVQMHGDFEHAECLRNIHRVAELRLDDALGQVPEAGNRVWDWAEALAAHSDPGYAERGELTVTYLTEAHRACAAQLAQWMRDDCGFDQVGIDAVGNVVGIYLGSDGSERSAPGLLTGSHYDTVRNGGRYDGRLGILVPMACVRELHRQGRRLPFSIEVVGFAEEEGQRYPATFLGSGALTGDFDPRWLEQIDVDGVSMRSAMRHADLDPDGIGALRRDPARYLGFVEVHIEQGPVLDALDLPLGVVTSINGGVRLLGEVQGMASHAGTTPMTTRRDAACGVAELMLFAERRAAAESSLVATVGMLQVPDGSINVVPGRCRFSLDIRATTDRVRDACVSDVRAELVRICDRRGLQHRLEETLRVAAAPSAPAWQQRWEVAVAALGLPVHRMPSGAGHDAMKLHKAMPQAMLFLRGGNAGISHNPLESITSDDADLCVAAFRHLLTQLDPGQP